MHTLAKLNQDQCALKLCWKYKVQYENREHLWDVHQIYLRKPN